MKCVGIVRRKAGQHARGGQQANDRGMSTAARILGVSRRDLGRFEKIAGISAEAKEEARRAQLDDNQRALLAIANLPAEKQVEKVRELEDQYSGGRRKRSAAAKSTSPSTVSTDDVEDDADESETDADSPRAAPSHKVPKEKPSRVKEDASDSETDTESPSTVPDDEEPEISPALLRKRDEKKLQTLKAIYAEHLEPEWKDKIQLQYVTEVLGVSAADIAHKEAVDFVIMMIDGRQWIHAMEVYANTDEHGFKRKHIRGALAYLGYRLMKKGRLNQLAWICKIADKDRVPFSMRYVDDDDISDDEYYNAD
jgi:hypothetical protein